jgi:DNA phosphorothioation system restriction enzyme
MRLVASPHLEEGDIEALERANANRDEILRSVASRDVGAIANYLASERLNALAWLAASGSLEVKLAVRVTPSGRIARGIYHEKIGIFTDSEGNQVAFTGSPNETSGGLVDNFESIEVFWSWDDPHNRVKDKSEHFEDLWGNRVPGLQVLDFTAISSELLRKYKLPHAPRVSETDVEEDLQHVSPDFHLPNSLVLREYQKDAIRAWLKNNGRGVFAMATGTGKTLAALALAHAVYQRNKPLVVVIVCPYVNLCMQWIRELEAFGARAVPCYDVRSKWSGHLQDGYQKIRMGVRDILFVVASNATFCTDAFQQSLKPGAAIHLLIADEMHNLGAEQARRCLPNAIPLRLGLSATPERHYDDVGSRALNDYFGPIVFEFSLRDAINQGFLVPYYYYPVLIDLSEEEAAEYLSLTQRISRLIAREDEDSDPSPNLMALLIARSRLIGAAANKLPKLAEIVRKLDPPARQALFYCGDGRTDGGEDAIRQISAVCRLLGDELGLRIRRFTYEETAKERDEILNALKTRALDGIVAIRCLDEGIDLPEVRLGFLLSSTTNPRQFIQRRGRLLRPALGKAHATIYDLIVRPPNFDSMHDDAGFNLERRMFGRELERIVEFCETALNGPAALGSLRDLRIRFNLLSTEAA